MKHFFAFCRRNRLFAALLAAELAVVCALAAGLFGAPYKLALTPGDFTNTLPDIAAADDDGLKIWNQIGYHSDDPMTFSADNIALPSGAYEVTVRYFSCQTPDAPTFNMLNAAGSLTFASERSPAAVQPKRRSKLSNREREELEKIPGLIEALEAEAAEISEKLADSEFVIANASSIAEINARLEQIRAEDERLMARWEELEALRAELGGK